MIGDIVPDDGPFMMDGTQHASEEELRIFRNTNGDYDTATLKPSGHLVIDVEHLYMYMDITRQSTQRYQFDSINGTRKQKILNYKGKRMARS